MQSVQRDATEKGAPPACPAAGRVRKRRANLGADPSEITGKDGKTTIVYHIYCGDTETSFALKTNRGLTYPETRKGASTELNSGPTLVHGNSTHAEK